MAKTSIYTQTEWQLQLSDANVLVMFNCYEIAQDSGYQKNASTLPSKMNQKKVSQGTGCEMIIGFGCALLASYLRVLPADAAFFSFQTQPYTTVQ